MPAAPLAAIYVPTRPTKARTTCQSTCARDTCWAPLCREAVLLGDGARLVGRSVPGGHLEMSETTATFFAEHTSCPRTLPPSTSTARTYVS